MPRYDDEDDDDDRVRWRYADDMRPHRAVLILIFSILGVVKCCFIWGLLAWLMGRADLQAMERGEMDPEGESMTRVGVILGMVTTLLSFLAVFGLIAMEVVLIFMRPGR